MAIKKIRMRPEGGNDYGDVLHPETSADMVLLGDGNNLSSHLVNYANFKNNIEAIRYVGEKIELKINGEWIEFKSGSPYPVGNVIDFSAKGDDKQVTLTWQDPADTTIDDSLGNPVSIAKWKGTKILRKPKEHGFPQNENDGVLVVDNGVRNQYQTTGFVDTGLVNNTEYNYMAFPYTEDGIFTVDESNRISATPAGIKIYGIEIDEANSNPETSVAYTDYAVGFAPMRGNNGSFQWGNWEQIFNSLEIKPCLVKNPQKTVNYYLDPNDYTKKLDGSLADITSGADGDVMVEFPKLYWKMWKVGNKQYVQWSTEMFAGAKCPAHTVGNIEKDRIYLPAYVGNTVSGKLRSLSGKTPSVSQTIGTFRNQAQANGDGYQQMGYYPLLMLQVLYVVFFKSRDSQTALGRGYVDKNSSSIATGNTNSKGMFFGETTGKQQNKFCGIEDFWGNVYYWIDGFYSDGSRNIMVSKQNVFNDNGSGYVNHGQGASVNIGGFIDSVQGSTDTGFVIKSNSGSSTTHYSDAGDLGGRYLPRFGGHWSSGSNAGAFQLYVLNSASRSDADIGARLCVL